MNQILLQTILRVALFPINHRLDLFKNLRACRGVDKYQRISLWMIKSRHHLLDAPKVPDGDITAAVYCRVRTLITGRSVGTGGIKQLDILLDRYFLLIRKRRHRSGMVPVDSFILEMKRLNLLTVFLLNVFGVLLPYKLTGLPEGRKKSFR